MRVFASKVRRAGLMAMAALTTQQAAALPIGFGINQGHLRYDEVTSDHFYVYLDHRTPAEGALTLNALEAARPHLELWLGQHRPDPLPVILSAQTTNASFANPITDALEIQSGGLGDKELAWHEYTHSTMYRSFDTWLGRSYDFLPLIPMPAWFIEGIAESTSVSVSSDVTSGIERYQALSGDWPSYDRLHSLYSAGNFATRGYATSGAFLSYMLRRGDANKLPDLLHGYFWYLMPWYWPGSLIPGNLPLDHALEDYLGQNSRGLFDEYQKAAKTHWDQAYEGPFFVGEQAARLGLRGTPGWRSDGEKITMLSANEDALSEIEIVFDDKSKWAVNWRPKSLLSEQGRTVTALRGQDFLGTVTYLPDPPQDVSTLSWQPLPTKDNKYKKLNFKRKGAISKLWETTTHLAWYEQEQSATRFCQLPKTGGSVDCPLTTTLPQYLKPIGERWLKPKTKIAGQSDVSSPIELWFSTADYKLTGTTYQIKVYDSSKQKFVNTFTTGLGQPIGAAFAGPDASTVWLLLAERDRRTLRRYTPDGTCLGMADVRDHVLDIKGLASGDLVLALYHGQETNLRRVSPSELKLRACSTPTGHMSPLQFALIQDKPIDLATAMQGASLWRRVEPKEASATENTVAASPSADKAVQPGTGSDTTPKPAEYRARPLFAFPWIGANDAYGPQIGVVSVPLMDHLQNETVRATFLVGIMSRFPNIDLSLTSTRWLPTINFSLFKQQTFNGLLSSGTVRKVQYMDEKGARLESGLGFRLLGGFASTGLAVKYAHLKPIIGFSNGIRRGFLVEPAASFGLFHSFGRLSLSNQISGRVAPAAFNTNFDYNQIGASSTLGMSLPAAARLSLGVEASRTRGKKMRELQEYYLPLRTFIPGSGGGYNQNSFPLGNANSGLFSPIQANTQGRFKADYNMPLLKDIDKAWWLLYLQRLDFTAFYNYGAAWNGSRPRRGWDKLLGAHGYSLDLRMENKGVHFNMGLGAGKVVGRKNFQPYATAGFDALF